MMRTYTTVLAVCAILMLGACGLSLQAVKPTAAPPPTDSPPPATFEPQDTGSSAALGEEIVLAPGELARYADGNLTVRFIAVTEDSRCPLDVDCFWSGLARVDLEVTAGNDEPHFVQLELMAEQPVSQQVGNYTITLVAVAPDPISTQDIQPDEYRVTIRVDG